MDTTPIPSASAATALDTMQANTSSLSAAAQAAKGDEIAKVSVKFEAQFLSQMFQFMFEGIDTDGFFGGGSAEKMFRSLLIDEYAKISSTRPGGSGLGIADQVQKTLLKQQEIS